MKITVKRHIKPEETPKEIIEDLLIDRNITSRDEFFNPTHPKEIELAAFFENKKTYLKKRDKVLNLLKQIREAGDTVVVYTDYDADGLTGGAILWETLDLLGFKARPYVPDRKREGYGFSKLGIDNIKKQFNPALIISVDHGIVGHAHIDYATSLGIPVVVTDHHTKDKTDPAALAVFHTSELSGSGVAYFFAKELFTHLKTPKTDVNLLSNYFKNDFVATSAIGAVADLVPLVGSNRALVKHGLSSFPKLIKPGLISLIKEAQITRPIGAYELGFLIAPRINAFGRIDDPKEALRLLCTRSVERAVSLSQKAGRINRERQQLVEEALVQAELMVDLSKKILIVSSPDWREGIIGLVAGKLTEKYHRPSIVLTLSGNLAKASARSISGFNITAFLRTFRKLLKSVGGHPAAAGLTIDKKNLHEFTNSVEKKADRLISGSELSKKLVADLKLSLSQADLELATALSRLSPFGIGNKTPLLLSEGIISHMEFIGDGSHVRVFIKDEKNKLHELMFFGTADHVASFPVNKRVKILYQLEVDTWNGARRARRIGKHLF